MTMHPPMNSERTPSAPFRADLLSLGQIELDTRHSALLDQARALCHGPAHWQRRKLAEAKELLAMAQLSGRLFIHWLDLCQAFRVLLTMRTPVPCRPGPDGALRVAAQATIGLTYRPEALRLPQPGFSFLQILEPGPVWHPNVALDHGQPLCLGPSLPAGIRVKELILMAYGALTLTSIQLDTADPAGVLNPEAADWWQRNLDKIPLSREPFLNRPTP